MIKKSPLLTLFAALILTLPVTAETPEGWTDNFAQALETAKASGKNILVDFTGSNWCPPCKRLHAEVLITDAFNAYAAQKWVLVYVDTPRQGPGYYEVRDQAQNDNLKKKFNITSFPTIVLLDADGNTIGQTRGYKAGGPEAYIAQLKGFIGFQGEMKTISSKIQALSNDADKARAYDELADKAAKLGVLGTVVDSMKTAFELDKDNAQGIALENAARLVAV